MEKSLRMALPLGFEVRLLELPQGEDPDTWCLKLGGEAFRELLGTAPDWTAFMIDRAMEGKDLRRISDRMGAFKDLLDFLPHLPRTTESRDLFASLAHQLQVPLQELDRAVRGRQAPAADTESARAGRARSRRWMTCIRSLLLPHGHRGPLARESRRSLPPGGRASPGAPLLQALLDAEGDPSPLPDGALAAIRHLEAQASHKDEAGRDADSFLPSWKAVTWTGRSRPTTACCRIPHPGGPGPPARQVTEISPERPLIRAEEASPADGRTPAEVQSEDPCPCLSRQIPYTEKFRTRPGTLAVFCFPLGLRVFPPHWPDACSAL